MYPKRHITLLLSPPMTLLTQLVNFRLHETRVNIIETAHVTIYISQYMFSDNSDAPRASANKIAAATMSSPTSSAPSSCSYVQLVRARHLITRAQIRRHICVRMFVCALMRDDDDWLCGMLLSPVGHRLKVAKFKLEAAAAGDWSHRILRSTCCCCCW